MIEYRLYLSYLLQDDQRYMANDAYGLHAKVFDVVLPVALPLAVASNLRFSIMFSASSQNVRGHASNDVSATGHQSSQMGGWSFQ
jgi:hypothetical protein